MKPQEQNTATPEPLIGGDRRNNMTITKKTLEGMAQTLSETTGENYYICYQYGRAYLYKHTEKGDEYLYPCCGTKSEVYYYMVAINNAVRDYKYKAVK